VITKHSGADVSSEHDLTSHSIIGCDEAPVVTLTSHDWLVENIPWYQPHVMQGAFVKPGHWAVEVAEAGDYEISLRRWPVEADAAINSGKYGKAFNFTEARLRVADIDTRMPIPYRREGSDRSRSSSLRALPPWRRFLSVMRSRPLRFMHMLLVRQSWVGTPPRQWVSHFTIPLTALCRHR
jgi:hypothetical protein